MSDEERKKDELMGTLGDAIKPKRAKKGVQTPENNEEFDLEFLLKMGCVSKSVEDGKVKASFTSNTTDTMFEIDNETDAITIGAVSNNVRKSLRYCCASIRGYMLGGKYTDLSGKGWKEREEYMMTLPNFLVNKLLRLHSVFERDASALFNADAIKK